MSDTVGDVKPDGVRVAPASEPEPGGITGDAV